MYMSKNHKYECNSHPSKKEMGRGGGGREKDGCNIYNIHPSEYGIKQKGGGGGGETCNIYRSHKMVINYYIYTYK